MIIFFVGCFYILDFFKFFIPKSKYNSTSQTREYFTRFSCKHIPHFPYLNPMKVLIVDDESKARDMLEFLLHNYLPQITDIRMAADARTALDLAPGFQPDLVFLDIQMPGMNGFDLLRTLGKWDFDVIFTTAHIQFAVQAIRFSALDYLLKPIDPDELVAAVQRHQARKHTEGTRHELVENLLHNLSSTDRDEFKLAIYTNDGTFFYRTDEIVRLEAERAYTLFFMKNGRKILVSKPLREFESTLEAHGFVRVHKSHLINRRFVQHCSADGNLRMSDGQMVQIARRRLDEVMTKLQ